MTAVPGRPAAFKRYVAGYGMALVATAAAFASVYWNIWNGAHLRIVVFSLGLAQMVIHFRYFMRRPPLGLLLFSFLIIALMTAGTLIVLFNLQSRMR